MKKRPNPRRPRGSASSSRTKRKKLTDKLYLVVIAAAVVVGVVGWLQWFDDDHAQHGNGGAALAIPAFTAEAEAGHALFEENCV